MKWKKLGLIFEPPRNLDWMVTHSALPFADKTEDWHRIYFSGRDESDRAQIGFFDINITSPKEILHVSEKAVIGLGPLGAFDDNGVTNSWIVNNGGKKYHYYTGWSLGVTVPFYLYVGLAVSNDGGKSFEKLSGAPILERNAIDPYLTASPCVVVESGVWKMWYVSGTEWEMKNDKPRHRYHIKYAESADGIHWKREGIVCLGYQHKDQYSIARPCVLIDDGMYKMWYSHRGESYRIGYAESKDGIIWERKDHEVGIYISDSGWDAEMIAYPFVFDHNGKRYMLYNGNGYGKTGIGLAVLSTEK